MRPGVVEHAVDAPLGDGADLGGRDGEVVGRQAERSAVEVPARLDSAIGLKGWSLHAPTMSAMASTVSLLRMGGPPWG